jgi:hypothetical protein
MATTMNPTHSSSHNKPVFFHTAEGGLPDMISFIQEPPSAEPGHGIEHTAESLQARITAMDPAVSVQSPGYEAALILLASVHVGQNVDRLARFTGLRRDVVARCARRLVDNGVWQDGNIVCRWLDTPEDTDSFWADAAVAEGRLCRRMGDDREMEWAPQGYWRKHYEYVGPREAEQPQSICYHAHVELGTQDLPYAADAEDEDVPAEVVPERNTLRQTVPDVAADAPVWLGGDEPASTLESPWLGDGSAATELFPDAVWLG